MRGNEGDDNEDSVNTSAFFSLFLCLVAFPVYLREGNHSEEEE